MPESTKEPAQEPSEPDTLAMDTSADSKKAPKDRWDKLQILGTVAMPLVALLLGHWLTQSLKQGETKARLVEVAVDVLKTDPKTTESVPGLGIGQ